MHPVPLLQELVYFCEAEIPFTFCYMLLRNPIIHHPKQQYSSGPFIIYFFIFNHKQKKKTQNQPLFFPWSLSVSYLFTVWAKMYSSYLRKEDFTEVKRIPRIKGRILSTHCFIHCTFIVSNTLRRGKRNLFRYSIALEIILNKE